MRAEQKVTVPADLKEAEGLLIQYGRWAKDTDKRQRCRSAEGFYVAPYSGRDEDGDAPPPLIPSWLAMNIQRALNCVPERERRVLQAYYIPQRQPYFVMMRKLGFSTRTWHEARVHGLRMWWNIYRLHFAKNSV